MEQLKPDKYAEMVESLWGDRGIEDGMRDYAEAVKLRQAHPPDSKRGALYASGNIIAEFLRLPDGFGLPLEQSFKVLHEKARASNNPAPAAEWKSWKDYSRGLKEQTRHLHRKISGGDSQTYSKLEEKIIERAAQLAPLVFQEKYPTYFPSEFWKRTLPSDQELFAGTVFLSGHRPNRPERAYWEAYRDMLRAAWACGFAEEYVWRLLRVPARPNDTADDIFSQVAPSMKITRTVEYSPAFQFQHDILTLARETWRAKTCAWCNRPFVASRNVSKYCPNSYASESCLTCNEQKDRKLGRDSWARHGKKWRPSSRPATIC
jgi:hypothetical protein